MLGAPRPPVEETRENMQALPCSTPKLQRAAPAPAPAPAPAAAPAPAPAAAGRRIRILDPHRTPAGRIGKGWFGFVRYRTEQRFGEWWFGCEDHGLGPGSMGGTAADLPQGETAADLPQGETEADLPQGETAADLPQGETAADLPQ
eukprot:gene23404-biopygen13368